jgi:hypothetical protein
MIERKQKDFNDERHNPKSLFHPDDAKVPWCSLTTNNGKEKSYLKHNGLDISRYIRTNTLGFFHIVLLDVPRLFVRLRRPPL